MSQVALIYHNDKRLYINKNNSNNKKNENEINKLTNSKIKENGSFQVIPTKKLKWTIKIKGGNEKKELVIYQGDDKIKKIEEFCQNYKLNNFEKEQIIKAISKKKGLF